MSGKLFTSFDGVIEGSSKHHELGMVFEIHAFQYTITGTSDLADEDGNNYLQGNFNMHIDPKQRLGMFLQAKPFVEGIKLMNIYKAAKDGARAFFKREEYIVENVTLNSVQLSCSANDESLPIIQISGTFQGLIEKFTPIDRSTGLAGAEQEYEHGAVET